MEQITMLSRQQIDQRSARLLCEIGAGLVESGAVREMAIYPATCTSGEVQGFYRLSGDPDTALHVHISPLKSSAREACLTTRLMDWEKMQALRASGAMNVGKEHKAVIRMIAEGARVAWESKTIVPELARAVEAYVQYSARF